MSDPVRNFWHTLRVALLCALALPLAGVTAQGETSLLEDLNLPALEVTVTDEGVSVSDSIAAGAVLVKVANETSSAVTFAIAMMPDDLSPDDLSTELTLAQTSGWVAGATIPGALDIEPMSSMSAVVLLDAGTWTASAAALSGEDEAGVALGGTTFTVTGTLDPAAADALPAGVSITYGNYAFDFAEPFPSGPQIVKITNSHDVLHHAVIFKTDRLYTQEEAHEGVMTLFSGSPEAEGFQIESPPVVVAPAISGGQSIWIELNLEPGFYIGICFISDPGADIPHVVSGMIGSFEVVAD